MLRNMAVGLLLAVVAAGSGCGGLDLANLSGANATSNPSFGNSGSGPSTTPYVYVSNSGSGTVSGFKIDTSTGHLTPLAGSPFPTTTPAGLARAGSGKYLTVANGALASGFPGISVIGTNSNTGAMFDLHCIDTEFPRKETPCYPLVPNTHGIPQFVAAQQEAIYIGNTGSDDVSVFLQDPKNGDLGTSIPSEFPSGVTGLKFLDFVGGKLWAAGNSGIVQLNTSPNAITLSTNFVLDGSTGYRAAAIHNSGNFFYAVDQADAVHVFCFKKSCKRGEQAQFPVPSPDGATSIAIQGDFAYVTHANSADVALYSINAESGRLALLASFSAGPGATSARIFLSKFLYVANSGDGTVSGYVIDSKNGWLSSVPGSPFQTGKNPFSIVAP